MSDETTVPPAMTAEEWATGTEFVDLENAPDDKTRELADSIERYIHGPNLPRLHAVAALALYGQPFGFTREDATLIFGLAHDVQARFGNRAYSNRIASIAARIAALLPPED